MGPLTTPKKGRDSRSMDPCDPWTPTSNLKILISAASPDIRNREKELCKDSDMQDTADISQDVENGEECERGMSRKEKSLGLLCHRFLARFPDCPNAAAAANDICLDDMATELNVERRRIYDIMNVLESLHMVSRSAKNRYTWHGRSKLAQTLAILKHVGEEQRYGQQMQHIRQHLLDGEFDEEKENVKQQQQQQQEDEDEEEVARPEAKGEQQGQKELFFVELPGVEFKAASVNSRKDKSLRVMSQKFVMLFLVSNPRVVSLDVAAKILIGEEQGANQDKNKFKTKVRRLYDIANVLRSLKLIDKVHVTCEERGRKPAFEWVGPEDFPPIRGDLQSGTAGSPAGGSRSVLEPRPLPLGNCAKNLFPSPGATKRSFTRHPSLIKMAKSIQDDRRKISSAPSSPAKGPLGDASTADFPSKMAQLAAICKIQLDQESTTDSGLRKSTPVSSFSSSTRPPQAPSLTPTHGGVAHLTPLTPLVVPPTAAAACTTTAPLQCSSLIPVLLPQHTRGGAYALYLPSSSSSSSSSARPNPLSRPQPTSLVVRSMTFEDKSGRSPMAQCVASGHKRPHSDSVSGSSPPLAKRSNAGFKDSSPKLGEILQARLQGGRCSLQISSRPSPRALHLDPEFVNTPGAAAAAVTGAGGGHTALEQSLETLLDASCDGEASLTPLRAVPLTPGQLQAETLIPAGYLIPISQQPLVCDREVQGSGSRGSSASTPTYNIYQTPTAGSRLSLAQEVTPTNSHQRLLRPAASPLAAAHRLHSPSPAILNFTLQNLGLIAPSGPPPLQPPPAGAFVAPQTPSGVSPLPQRNMVFIKPVSPLGTPPLTLISLQQPLATPTGRSLPQHSFFHTPVAVSPLAALVTSSSGGGGATPTRSVFVAQRKLEVAPDEA